MNDEIPPLPLLRADVNEPFNEGVETIPEPKLTGLQNAIRVELQNAIELGAGDVKEADTLVSLFAKINDFAWAWLNEKPLKEVSPEMTCLFSASSALITRYLHVNPGFLAKLVAVLEISQTQNGNYGIKELESLPKKRLHITATGGERGCRTLYVTIATGMICSQYLATVVQGNYSVTGCNCGSFAESDMMEEFQYRLGSSKFDTALLIGEHFAYLHVQRYHPILKVFCSERGSLSFRDMMKVAVVLADPYSCPYQYIGVWDKGLMLPMAQVLNGRKCVTNGAVVSSEFFDEFTDAAAVTINGDVKYIDNMSSVSHPDCDALRSVRNVKEECSILEGFFSQDWSKPDDKLELVLQNAAFALAMSHEDSFLATPVESIRSWRKTLLDEAENNKMKCKQLILKWGSFLKEQR